MPARLTLGELKKQETHIRLVCRSVGCYHEATIPIGDIKGWDSAPVERVPWRCSKCTKMLVMWGRAGL